MARVARQNCATDTVLRLQAAVSVSGVVCDWSGPAETSKRPYKDLDFKRTGQHVDADIEHCELILLRNTLLDNSPAHGGCWTVVECAMTENMNQAAWNLDRDVFCPAGRTLIATDGIDGRFPGPAHDVCNGAVIGGRDVELGEADLERAGRRESRAGQGIFGICLEAGPTRHGAVPRSGRSG
jgi:hypothetical protein